QGEPLGQRIILSGRVTDSDGRAVPDTLIEIWQANAAGRYLDPVDDHPAPLDPNFTGAGRGLTDAEGRYRFVTVKPGAYPWRLHRRWDRSSALPSRLWTRPMACGSKDRCLTGPGSRSRTRCWRYGGTSISRAAGLTRRAPSTSWRPRRRS